MEVCGFYFLAFMFNGGDSNAIIINPIDTKMYMLWLIIALSLNSVATQLKPNKPKFNLKLFSTGTVIVDWAFHC